MQSQTAFNVGHEYSCQVHGNPDDLATLIETASWVSSTGIPFTRIPIVSAGNGGHFGAWRTWVSSMGHQQFSLSWKKLACPLKAGTPVGGAACVL